MAWDRTLPANATKIRLTPAILQANWDALEFGQVPYDALRLEVQAAAPTRVASHGFLYSKDPGTGITSLYYEDDQNPSVNTQLITNTSTPGIGALGQLIYGSAVITSGTYQNTQNAFCSAWAAVNSDGSIANGFGVTSASAGTGLYTITFTTPLSTASYCVVGTVFSTGSHNRDIMCTVRNANSFTVRIQSNDGGSGTFENNPFMVAVFGGR